MLKKRSIVGLVSLGLLVGCGQPTRSGGGGSDDEDTAPFEQVKLQGVSETSFNPLDAEVRFELQQGSYTTTEQSVVIFNNGHPIPKHDVTVDPDAVVVNGSLEDGMNHLEMFATDEAGELVFAEAEVWAGSNTMVIEVIDPQGLPASGAQVTAELADDKKVGGVLSADGGQAIFANVPDRTIMFSASATGGQFAISAALGSAPGQTLMLTDVNPPSSTPNNDFSQGLEGWDTSEGNVELVPGDNGDLDLVITTSGEGSQKVSRSFEVTPGTKNVTVRYRFITSEIPGGYYGSKFNDFYSVTLRTQSGGIAKENASMNGLGLGTFDGAGATGWSELTLPVQQGQLNVQLDAVVANVGDGKYDSQLIIEQVKESTLAITKLELRDLNDGELEFLSAAKHSYYAGHTRLRGVIAVEGAEGDSLQSLELEVIQNGQTVATAELADNAEGKLLKAFGSEALSFDGLLFELASEQAGKVDSSVNGTLMLRARARSSTGEQAVMQFGPVEILKRYTGDNRYGGRDEGICVMSATQTANWGNKDYQCGGDDWLLPSVGSYLAQFASDFDIGDISHMNGGVFPPHGSHRTGNDVDGWFEGYNARNAATAAKMLSWLEKDCDQRIEVVLVTYQAVEGNAFYDAIKDAYICGDREATEVIRPVGGHTTHFHLRISD